MAVRLFFMLLIILALSRQLLARQSYIACQSYIARQSYIAVMCLFTDFVNMAGQCLILVVLSLLCMAFSFEISRTGMYDYTHVHVNRVTKHNNHEKPLLGYILSCFSMLVTYTLYSVQL